MVAFLSRLAALWGLLFGACAALGALGADQMSTYLAAYASVAWTTSLGGRWAAHVPVTRRALGPAAAVVIAFVLLAGRVEPGLPWAALHGLGLLTTGAVLGAALGREVVDPKHLWPLAIVGAAADLWSVTAPAGLTRAVLEGRAPVSLAAVVVHLPTVGEAGLEPGPVLGLGDLLFTGFLLGAAERLGLSPRRGALGLAAGFGLCLGGLLLFEVPLPALPFIALTFVAAQGRAVAPRARELGAALGLAALLLAAGGVVGRVAGG